MPFKRLMMFLCAGFLALNANAGLILTLSDGTNTVSSADGGALDINPVTGAVTYSGSIGSWIVNVTTGLSKPLIGSPYADEMHLASVNVTGSSGGWITLTLEDDGFDKLSANWISGIGGWTSGSVAASTYIDGALVASYTGTGGAFSNTQSGQVNALAPYSMKLAATITHSGAFQHSSFDYVVKVPEPGTLSLLGIGLLGLGLARRRARA